jgi:hypothetical protein
MATESPALLQQLLLADYVSKIEAANIDPRSTRDDIIDLAKLIVHSLLYRHFDAELLSRVLGSEIIVRWNRANPQALIDEKAFAGSAAALRLLIREQSAEVDTIRGMILDPLKLNIANNERLDDDEKKIEILQIEKFLDVSNVLLWYVLLKFRGDWNFRDLTMLIRSCLVEYLKKVQVADYIALMIMELALAAENQNIQREAERQYPHTVPGGGMDVETLSSLIQTLKAKNSLISIAWKLGGAGASIGTKRKLLVVFYDGNIDFKEIRNSIETVRAADMKKKSIYNFYRELEGGRIKTDLGLYYMSYLEEACERVGIKFESLVNQIPDTKITMITLSFIL